MMSSWTVLAAVYVQSNIVDRPIYYMWFSLVDITHCRPICGARSELHAAINWQWAFPVAAARDCIHIIYYRD